MGDEEPEKAVKAAPSASELRERRKQKILENRAGRMGKILGTDNFKVVNDELEELEGSMSSTYSSIQSTLTKKTGETTTLFSEEITLGLGASRSVKAEKEGDKVKVHQHLPQEATTKSEGDGDGRHLGFMVTHADGSTTHPKLSTTTCRVFVFLLGIFLSIFNAKFFLLTFLSWEMAVFFVNGLPNEDVSSHLILLITLAGLKEGYVQRLKLFLKVSNCILTDLSILMVSALSSRVAYEYYTLS